MFKLSPNADINGTHKVGDLCNVSPAELVAAFGAPGEDSEDGKTNGAFYFESTDADSVTRLFTVYAYKHRVDWDSTTAIDWSVGGFTAPAEFIHWLVATVRKPTKTDWKKSIALNYVGSFAVALRNIVDPEDPATEHYRSQLGPRLAAALERCDAAGFNRDEIAQAITMAVHRELGWITSGGLDSLRATIQSNHK